MVYFLYHRLMTLIVQSLNYSLMLIIEYIWREYSKYTAYYRHFWCFSMRIDGISKFPIRHEAKIDIRSIVHELSWIFRTGSSIVISQLIVFVEARTKLLIRKKVPNLIELYIRLLSTSFDTEIQAFKNHEDIINPPDFFYWDECICGSRSSVSANRNLFCLWLI